MRFARTVCSFVLSVSAALAGCGKGSPGTASPPPPGTVVSPTVRSGDTAVAKIQEYIERNAQAKRPDKSAPAWRTALPMRPKVAFESARAYIWILETEFGPVQVRLLAGAAPEHAANAIYLSLLGFYDGLSIHTIVPGKALESGDPADDGKGSPGYAFSPEATAAKHDRRGIVSALSQGPSTDDSKFRIMFGPDPSIDPRSTVFGEVENGFDALQRIEALGTPDGRPKRHVAIRRATIAIR